MSQANQATAASVAAVFERQRLAVRGVGHRLNGDRRSGHDLLGFEGLIVVGVDLLRDASFRIGHLNWAICIVIRVARRVSSRVYHRGWFIRQGENFI